MRLGDECRGGSGKDPPIGSSWDRRVARDGQLETGRRLFGTARVRAAKGLAQPRPL